MHFFSLRFLRISRVSIRAPSCDDVFAFIIILISAGEKQLAVACWKELPFSLLHGQRAHAVIYWAVISDCTMIL
jgi:hypothetical protein